MPIAVGFSRRSALCQRPRSATRLSALVALGFITSAQAGGAFVPVPIAPQAQRLNFDGLTLTSLRDAQIAVPNDGSVFGIGVGPGAVSKVLRKARKPEDRWPRESAPSSPERRSFLV